MEPRTPRYLPIAASILAVGLLAGFGGSNPFSNSNENPAGQNANQSNQGQAQGQSQNQSQGPQSQGQSQDQAQAQGTGSGSTTPTIVSVPNVSSANTFSFDLGLVSRGRYYLTDRTNRSVDVVDTQSNQLITQITGTSSLAFAGVFPNNNDKSGPDGINRVTGTDKLYVGDVNSVKVIRTNANGGTIEKSIPVLDANGNTTGNRADEGCYDKEHHIMMFSSPADGFATWFNTDTDTVIARFDFPDNTTGLEACVYDPATNSFLINNDGTDTNPKGELDRISADSVLAGAPTLVNRYALGNCSPAGLALGPRKEVLVGCDPAAGAPLISLIVDRQNGQIVKTIPFGGVDQVAYDRRTNRYYLAARHWVEGGTASDANFNPVLGIIDANSGDVVAKLEAGNNAHSVAVDPRTLQAYVPFSATKGSSLFAEGGIAVYAIGNIGRFTSALDSATPGDGNQ